MRKVATVSIAVSYVAATSVCGNDLFLAASLDMDGGSWRIINDTT